MGEAAVSANLVSPSLLIIIAITAIGNNAIPNYSVGTSLRFLRFFLVMATFILGLYSLILGIITYPEIPIDIKVDVNLVDERLLVEK